MTPREWAERVEQACRVTRVERLDYWPLKGLHVLVIDDAHGVKGGE